MTKKSIYFFTKRDKNLMSTVFFPYRYHRYQDHKKAGFLDGCYLNVFLERAIGSRNDKGHRSIARSIPGEDPYTERTLVVGGDLLWEPYLMLFL